MSVTFTFTDAVNSYSSPLYLPDVEKPMEMRGATVSLLSGGTFLTVQTDGSSVAVVPAIVILRWSQYIPDALLGYFEAAFLANRSLTVVYPWRTSTGTITGRIIPNGYKVTQRRGKTYGLEVTIQTVSV